ncbi:hypothetical protein [Microcoleus sp. F10-A1]|uniref:hypothetical protein n=1 Tax=Microcoleus sp. F10-A1 TaxID=2818750 RepID=UPI002FD08D9F
MLIRKVLIILNIIGLVGCLIWVVNDPGWEPVVGIVGLIATLITQLHNAEGSGAGDKLTQKGGQGSTNYQSNGNMTINNNPTTTINHYGSTETMWIGQTDKPTITHVNLEGRNSEYCLELLEPVFVTEVNGYTTCLPEQTYKLEIVVNYLSKTETKFYANIYPDAENYLLHHLAHKDNVKSLGRPLIGFGYIRFQLTGTAPKEPGTYEREINIGLLHFKNWKHSEVLFNKFYKFKLVVFSTETSKGPFATSEVNPETGVSFMVLKEKGEGTTSETNQGETK